MLINEKAKLDEILSRVAAALDIPDYVYEDATLKYHDVCSWLAENDSELSAYSPELYPQGSFRLGTVVHPISKEDGYDIDLVCHLAIDKEQSTQDNLKQIIGARLKKRADLNKILTPSRRCWILDYLPEAQMPRFHMDILPAIPNRERPPTGILLTDTDLIRWQKSNPKAYASWFYDRMKVIFMERRNTFAKSMQIANVEDVPDWQVKTPLQMAVQILKRHRDIYFPNNPDIKPISIIITTLAARAYNNQANIYDALTEIIRDIENNWGKPGYVENRNGRWWVANPVDPDENFADKWNDYPDRREAFVRWLKKAHADIIGISREQTLNKAIDALSPVMGEEIAARVATDMGLNQQSLMTVPSTSQAQVPALGDVRHCKPPVWPMQECYKVNVIGSICFRKGGKRLWELTNRPVPKKVWLRFSIATSVPAPYSVKWQVVNTGKEASEAGQLRGEFYDNDENMGNIRWETTSYRGTHWIEAFVIKNGVCLTRSGRKLVRIR